MTCKLISEKRPENEEKMPLGEGEMPLKLFPDFKSKIIDNFQQLLATFKYICNNPVKAEMVETSDEYQYGGLWYIRHKLFDIVEPPDFSTKIVLTDL